MNAWARGAHPAWLLVAAQALLAEVQPYLDLQGDVTMFVMDVPPDVPPQFAPIVVAQVSQTKQQTTDRTIGVCHLIENTPERRVTAINHTSPVGAVWSYLKRQEHTILEESDYKNAKMSLLLAPEHGTLEMGTRGAQFHPTDDYLGSDQATFLVEIGGYKVKVIYFFKLMEHVPTGTQVDPYTKENCPEKAEIWKISLNPNDPNAPIYTFEHPPQLTSALASVVQANLTFADLAGSALGETQFT